GILIIWKVRWQRESHFTCRQPFSSPHHRGLKPYTTVRASVYLPMPEMSHTGIIHAAASIRNYPFNRPLFLGIGAVISCGQYRKLFYMPSWKTVNLCIYGFPSFWIILVDGMSVEDSNQSVKSVTMAGAFALPRLVSN